VDKLGFGRKIERLVMERWVWRGYLVWQPPRAQYRKLADGGTDIFGLFDFIAIKSDCPVNLVQVKRMRREEAQQACDAIKTFVQMHPCPIDPYLVLWTRRKDRLQFVAWELTPMGWTDAGQWTEVDNGAHK
jgi:hypothetical protein